MKKFALLAVAVLFSVAAYALVKVSQNGNITTYEKDVNVTVSGKSAADVLYNGVLVSVPKGQKVVISKNKEGKVLVSGDTLKEVKVAGQTVNINEPATLVVDPDSKDITTVTVAEQLAAQQAQAQADAQEAAKAAKEQAKAAKEQAQAAAKAAAASANQNVIVEEISFPEASNYVNEIVSEQAIENVEEQLSPSAPRI